MYRSCSFEQNAFFYYSSYHRKGEIHFILLPWRQVAQCIIWMEYYRVAMRHACNKAIILNSEEPSFFSLPLLPCCSLIGPPGGSVWAEFRQHDHPPEEPHHDRRTESKYRHAFIWIYHSCSLLDIERICFADALSINICVCVLGFWAERVEENHWAAKEAKRSSSSSHQRRHQHSWTLLQEWTHRWRRENNQ